MRTKTILLVGLLVVALAAVFPIPGAAGGAGHMLGQRIGLLEADEAEQNRTIYLLQKRVACLEIKIKRPNYNCGPLLQPLIQK